MIEFTVIGEPGPQGSKRHVGNGVMIESSKKVKPWREDVKNAAIEAMGGIAGNGIKGPVKLRIVFTVRKPKSAPKSRKIWADKRPDLDKLARSTFDALKSAGMVEDDSRIVECWLSKTFPNEGEYALPVLGAYIMCTEAT